MMLKSLAVFALSLTLGLTPPAQAQSIAAEDAQAVIRAQIDAFVQDDFAAAFDFASPAIRAIFGSSDRFATMVTTGYPMVHRPADLRFIGQVMRDDTQVQRVMITDQSGVLHILEYDVISVGQTLRIDAVRLLRGGQAGA